MIKKIIVFSLILMAQRLSAMDIGQLYRQTQETLVKEIAEQQEQIPADKIVLISSDNVKFTVPLEAAKQSEMIKHLLADEVTGLKKEIPLSKIASTTLKEIINLLTAMQQHQDLKGKKLLDKLEQEVPVSDIYELLKAANYLDIKPIIELATRAIAKGLLKTNRELFEPELKKIAQKIEEKKLLEDVFHYYFLFTGIKIGGFPQSIYTVSAQEKGDYPQENWVSPSFPALGLSLIIGKYIGSQLTKPAKEIRKKGHLGLKTITLATDGHEFEVPLDIALQSEMIKFHYQNNPEIPVHYFKEEIPPHIMEQIADLMWAIEANKNLENRALFEALAKNVPEIKMNPIEVLQAADILQFIPSIAMVALFINNSDLKKLGTNVYIHDQTISELARYYYLFHGHKIEGLSGIHFKLSIQDYLDYLPSKIKNQRSTLGNYYILSLANLKLNSLKGLANIPNVNKISLLNLTGNELSSIEPNSFSMMHNLDTLVLSWNHITKIEDINTFNGLDNLKTLNLISNDLEYINPKVLNKFKKLEWINVNGNPLDPKNIEEIKKIFPEIDVYNWWGKRRARL